MERGPRDVISHDRRRQVLQDEAGWVGHVDERGRNANRHVRRDIAVEAVLALPHPHHLADEDTAGISRRQLHDDGLGRAGVVRRQPHTGQLPHEPFTGSDLVDGDGVDRDGELFGEPSRRDRVERAWYIPHGRTVHLRGNGE